MHIKVAVNFRMLSGDKNFIPLFNANIFTCHLELKSLDCNRFPHQRGDSETEAITTYL